MGGGGKPGICPGGGGKVSGIFGGGSDACAEDGVFRLKKFGGWFLSSVGGSGRAETTTTKRASNLNFYATK